MQNAAHIVVALQLHDGREILNKLQTTIGEVWYLWEEVVATIGWGSKSFLGASNRNASLGILNNESFNIEV